MISRSPLPVPPQMEGRGWVVPRRVYVTGVFFVDVLRNLECFPYMWFPTLYRTPQKVF